MAAQADLERLAGSAISVHIKDAVVIGRGGFATVYKAYHTGLDRTVAIKITSAPVGDKIAVARLLRESQGLERLDHPSIVKVYSVGVTADDSLYVAMEFVPGKTLFDEIHAAGGLSLVQAREIFHKILQGVAEVHRHGFVHRDLSAKNCMVDAATGVVKIIDFGLLKSISNTAAISDERLTRTGLICGTATNISPEACLGKPVDERSDIYSLGCLLYEMVAGRPPYIEPTPEMCMLQHVKGTPPPIWLDPNTGCPKLEAVIAKAMAKRPEDRFQSVEQFDEALVDITESESGSQHQQRPGLRKSINSGNALRCCVLLGIGTMLIVAAAFICRRDAVSDPDTRLTMLVHERRNVEASIADLSKRAVADGSANRDSATVRALKDRLFTLCSEICQLRTQQFLQSKPDLRPYNRKMAADAYYVLLPQCNTFDQRLEAFENMSFIARCEPPDSELQKLVAYSISQQVQRDLNDKNVDRAILLYRRLTPLQQRLSKEEEKVLLMVLFDGALENRLIDYAVGFYAELLRKDFADADVLTVRTLDALDTCKSREKRFRYYERVRDLYLSAPVVHSFGRITCLLKMAHFEDAACSASPQALVRVHRQWCLKLALSALDEANRVKVRDRSVYVHALHVITDACHKLTRADRFEEEVENSYRRAAQTYTSIGEIHTAISWFLVAAYEASKDPNGAARMSQYVQSAWASLKGTEPDERTVEQLVQTQVSIVRSYLQQGRFVDAANCATEGLKFLKEKYWLQRAGLFLYRSAALREAKRSKEAAISAAEGISCLERNDYLNRSSHQSVGSSFNEPYQGLMLSPAGTADPASYFHLMMALNLNGEIERTEKLLKRITMSEVNRRRQRDSIAGMSFELYDYFKVRGDRPKTLELAKQTDYWCQQSSPEFLLAVCMRYRTDQVLLAYHKKRLQDAIASLSATDKERAAQLSEKLAAMEKLK